MALRSFMLTCRANTHLHNPRPTVFCPSKVGSSSIASSIAYVEPVRLTEERSAGNPGPSNGEDATKVEEPLKWKKLDSYGLGIKTSMISKPTRVVLNALRKKGYDVYLVGGCVRDLILKKTPKDFDIITSAELREVRNTFSRCEIVGRRFPICHVHVGDTIVEVSSFSTSSNNFGVRIVAKRSPGCHKDDYLRWSNCLKRDFTINGLMFDPYAKIIYDYIGGVDDLKKEKVRTVIPSNLSFVQDRGKSPSVLSDPILRYLATRILRAFRIAARLGFRFTKDVAFSIKELSCSILRLDKGRILMEMNYMLAYGSGEASLRLLWRFGLLEVILPIQASYLVSQGFKRRDKGSNMLLKLFSNLDKLLAPDRPCHSSLWIALLAFHKALFDKPWDPVVVAAFSLTVHSGGSLREAVKIARNINEEHDPSFIEIQESDVRDSKLAIIDDAIDLAASIKTSLLKLTDECLVSQAMSKYPQAPRSDMVFISEALSQRVCNIFECVRRDMNKGSMPKQGFEIDYDSLSVGNLQEVRRVFARVVFDTIYPRRKRE